MENNITITKLQVVQILLRRNIASTLPTHGTWHGNDYVSAFGLVDTYSSMGWIDGLIIYTLRD